MKYSHYNCSYAEQNPADNFTGKPVGHYTAATTMPSVETESKMQPAKKSLEGAKEAMKGAY